MKCSTGEKPEFLDESADSGANRNARSDRQRGGTNVQLQTMAQDRKPKWDAFISHVCIAGQQF